MVALSFSEERFVPMILDADPWLKDQTTRPFSWPRYRSLIKPNVDLQLYFKQRHPSGYKFADATTTEVFVAVLKPDGPRMVVASTDGTADVPKSIGADDFARRDGFDGYEQMYAWFVTKYGQAHVNAKVWLVTRWTNVRRCVA